MGLYLADALGVSVEFMKRSSLRMDSVVGGLAGLYYGYDEIPKKMGGCYSKEGVCGGVVWGV